MSDRSGAPLSRTSTREAVQQSSQKYLKVLKMLLVDPLQVILYIRFMPVLLTVYYSAITFGSLYVLNISVQYTFERPPYQFSTIIIGLLYIPNSIGYILASVFGGRWMDSIMKREALKARRIDERGKLIFHPEDRMRENAWLGALLYPVALVWYGWTAEKGVLWIVPVSHPWERMSYAGTGTDTWSTDDCELLLRRWLHAYFCHVDHYVDGIHATTIIFGRRLEQFLPKYPVVCWCNRWCPRHLGHWQWLAFYYFGNLDTVQRIRDMGDETIRASMARENG